MAMRSSRPLVTIWCGRGGLYRSKLDAIRNGEQLVESALLVDTPDLAELAIEARHG